jgi:UPF0716 protein FxsA
MLFLTMLPLIEIAGFILIGGKIGVGLSLLWVIASVFAGFYFLMTMGGQTLRKARKSVDADVYPFEEMFDGICVLIGALLLIFPGFVSDFLAVPLLAPFLRRGIFRFLKYQHAGLWNDLGKNAEGFTAWYYEERKGGVSKIIEGEFTHTDDDTKKIH